MTAITTNTELPGAGFAVDPAEVAAIAFLARYSGRTLDAYRHDLRNLFQWAADHVALARISRKAQVRQ